MNGVAIDSAISLSSSIMSSGFFDSTQTSQTHSTNNRSPLSTPTSTSSSTTTSSSSSSYNRPPTNKAPSKAAAESSSSSAGEDEFLIAADLTLYANPLRCLQPKKSKTTSTAASDAEKDKEGGDGKGPGARGGNATSVAHTKGISDQSQRYANDENTMIAADLVKYGSPLDG